LRVAVIEAGERFDAKDAPPNSFETDLNCLAPPAAFPGVNSWLAFSSCLAWAKDGDCSIRLTLLESAEPPIVSYSYILTSL